MALGAAFPDITGVELYIVCPSEMVFTVTVVPLVALPVPAVGVGVGVLL